MAFVLAALFVGIVAMLIGYAISPMRAACGTLRGEVSRLESEVQVLRNAMHEAEKRLGISVAAFVEAHRYRRRAETLIESLRDAGADRVRWGSLHQAGIRTLADLDRVNHSNLLSLPGVGHSSAAKIDAAASFVRGCIVAEAVPLPGSELGEPHAVELVGAVFCAIDASQSLEALVNDIESGARDAQVEAGRIAAQLGFTSWIVQLFRDEQLAPGVTLARALTTEIREMLNGETLSRTRTRVEAVFHRALNQKAICERYLAELDLVHSRIEAAAPGIRFARFVRPSEWNSGFPASQYASGKAPTPRDGPGAKFKSDSVLVVAQARSEALSSTPVEAERTQQQTPAFSYVPDRKLQPRASLANESVDVRWIQSKETVSVQGFSIPGGLIYVGQPGECTPDPCFINPSLPVDAERLDCAGSAMPYWPSYSSIAPGCRAAYLRWLADGREDSSFNIGYVFLFFYGLERRLLRERAQCPQEEFEEILVEVERLLRVYQQNRSFQRYAGSFLQLMRSTVTAGRLYEAPPPTIEKGSPSLALKVGLGQAFLDRKPLPPGWALAWYFACDPARHSCAATHCQEELLRLFETRYSAELGVGFVIPTASGRLTESYRPASAAFEGEVVIDLAVPIVSLHPASPGRIVAIAESCTGDLEAYARSFKRKSAKSALARIALLPSELVVVLADDRLVALRKWLEEVVPADAPVLVQAGDLAERCIGSRRDRLERKEVTEAALILQRFGFGIEPDPRFGGGAIFGTERVCLFRLPSDAPLAPSDGYSAAELLIRLCVAVACADDTASSEERRCVEGIASSLDGLGVAEQRRLDAHALRLFECRTALGSIAKRVANLPLVSRDRLGTLLVGVAAVDGRIGAQEISVLTRIYAALGLDPAAVYREAHARAAATVTSDEPVVVQRADGQREASEYSIPSPKAIVVAQRGKVQIDAKLLARKQEETNEVQSMLAPLFVEDVAPTAQCAARPGVASPSDVDGLDARHAALLRRLAEREMWDRAEIDAICDELGLLTAGALEVLNDRACDHVGGPVVEGENSLRSDKEAIRSWLT